MPFIGNQPALSYTSFAKQDFSTSATTSYTLDNPVANANELALFINFVRQEPTTAYSASGTTLTLTSATSASDDMYCVYLGKAVQTVNPPNASVGASQLVDASITSGKLASGVLPTNTPAFEAYLSGHFEVNHATSTKIQFDTERFDTDSCYDNSTNYRFTPTVAGKYLVYTNARLDGRADSNLNLIQYNFKKNGSIYTEAQAYFQTNYIRQITISRTAVIDMNGSSDYLETFLYMSVLSTGSGNPRMVGGSGVESNFGAYKLIGV